MSLFANVNMANVKTGSTQKQPVWEPHAQLANLDNDEFSFRTVSSEFCVGGINYKVSCFQMRSGFYDRNTNVEGAVKFAQMIQHVEQALNDTGLSQSFGLDCSTFKQDQGKNASRNLCIYVMPRLPNGVRSHLDAMTQDLVKPVQTKTQQTQAVTQPNTGWSQLAQPQVAQNTTPPWGAK